ncbi:hypothetical protein EHV10_12070 [Lachnoanaerobaculum gingivalis]|uniref:PIN like domain-containing protein n=1 Tax=Lachnoanaerobaculum gingivalis TaxID=2490855 RepID=A0A3P3QTE9_9FIRM|nr:PIN-like domain-containing protein [Lachnoanaerobaculum gingivalis]RRJ24517.1 hypothetical protein EHV10_12070 [Lachnoanaerobaculum gingivalis]
MIKYNEFEKKLKAKDTMIILDTNVILDLARYSIYTSKNIMGIFYKCSDLIWIPNQVIMEYNKNKYQVFGNLKKKYSNFEKDLKKIIDDSKEKFRKIFKNSERYSYHGREKYASNILKKLDEAIVEIESYKDFAGVEYEDYSIEKDIEKFVDDLKNKNQVGCKIGFIEKMEIIKEGDLRYKYSLPPGFEDDKKDGIEKFGDLFVWKEILKLPSLKKVNNVIFITNDEKDDWWDKEELGKVEETKILLNLRSELYEEFTEMNPGVSIDFMTIKTFQEYASRLYNMFESQVYIDLNRDDDSFIHRVNEKIEEDIQDDLYINSEYYLGFDMDIDCVEDCTFMREKNVYSFLSEGGICINYELEYRVELHCDSDDEHIFVGTVVVSIDRCIDIIEVENNHKYLNEDNEYCDFSIIAYYIEQY